MFEKFLNWQTLAAGILAFSIGSVSQGYAVGSWKTDTENRITNLESIAGTLSVTMTTDHDKIIAMDERTKAMSDRLDAIANSIRDIRNTLVKTK